MIDRTAFVRMRSEEHSFESLDHVFIRGIPRQIHNHRIESCQCKQNFHQGTLRKQRSAATHDEQRMPYRTMHLIEPKWIQMLSLMLLSISLSSLVLPSLLSSLVLLPLALLLLMLLPPHCRY